MQILTELEQGSEEWKKARLGKISGTKLGTVMGGPVAQRTLMFELVGEPLCPPEEEFKSAAMQRGNDLEGPAIERFEEESGKKVEQVGLIVKNEDQILSPDGIILDEDIGLYTEALEVKCLSAKKMVRYMACDTFAEVFKIEKSYYWQVVNYFICMPDLEKLTFYLYNPDMYEYENQVCKIEVTRAELQKDIEKAELQLLVFIAELKLIRDSLDLK